jgi:uncharacterized membrane protein YdbT with pleckstrin-like domain
MAFPKRLLIEGEQLVLDLRPHWIALVLPAVVTVVALAAAIWLTVSFESGPLTTAAWAGFVLLLLAFPVRRVVWWLTSMFAVTSDRVIHREGFIAKRSMEIPLEAINDVRFDQGVFDRIVGAGSIIISSASEAGSSTFEDIPNPEEVQRTIYHQGELNKKRMYQGDRLAAPSVTTELERLATLRANGVLTEEEFQAQKAKLLNQP